MRPFLIDCDTGTDDAIAIAAAFGCPDIEIKAITSVNGNVAEQYVCQNNLDLAEYLGFSGPVCKGAARPFCGSSRASDGTHGKTGLGDVLLPKAGVKQFDPRLAPEMIHDAAVAEQGKLEILATGPLTNLGIALLLYPDLPSLIHHIWFMGGAVYGGNVTTSAEFNIWVDPEAAQVVMDSGIPLTMVGLDVTLKACMEPEDEVQLRAAGGRAALLTADLLNFMFRRHAAGGEAALMHDALALAAAVYPQCMEMEEYYINVECQGQYTRGHTSADVRHRSGQNPNVSAAMKLDVEKFRKWLVQAVIQSQAA